MIADGLGEYEAMNERGEKGKRQDCMRKSTSRLDQGTILLYLSTNFMIFTSAGHCATNHTNEKRHINVGPKTTNQNLVFVKASNHYLL
jgi:hypothetical protein